MKRAPLFFFTLAVLAQQPVQTGPATTKGSCSPANTGNINTFTIICGIGKEQGDDLPKIVNKILANQKDLKEFGDKLDEILKRVDEIRKSTADRHYRISKRRSSWLQ